MTCGKPFVLLGLAVAAAGFGSLGWFAWRLDQRLAELTTAQTACSTTLATLDREVTRMRVEQRAEGKGPQALLEKLATYAPLLSSARTTQPDYQAAKLEMDAIKKAFAALGNDGWTPLMKAWQKHDANDFDQLKWLLDCAIAVDPAAGKELCKRALLGQEKPNPRLRWWAADLMVQNDRQLAQQLLRQILTVESSRGINPERAAAYNVPILDTAAIAVSGYHNFIDRYVQSGDDQIDQTLLMLLGRTEHDLPTIQHCVKLLGERKHAPAAKRIEELYRKPPGIQDNPIFVRHCLDALASIRGPEIRPWLEAELKNATNELVARHLQVLLDELDGKPPQPSPPIPAANQGTPAGQGK
ncbi:MAG: hypothetical protein IPK26_05080 [Planctomycetes bacterium]|nr:hypothetical protein [Planctomycetota bacterium]